MGSAKFMMTEKPFGVLGGMGPLSSQLFYQLVTEQTLAHTDQEHLNLLIYSAASVPDRTGAILSEDAGRIAHVRAQLRERLLLLEQNGCAGAAVICNTAHYFVDSIVPELHIPVLHLINEAAAEAASRQPQGRVAVLATDGTMRAGLYQRALGALGVESYAPEADLQALVMQQIYERIKRGIPADASVWKQLEDTLRRAGCSQALLACTELSYIRVQLGLGDFFVDPLVVLAQRTITFMGKTVRPECALPRFAAP